MFPMTTSDLPKHLLPVGGVPSILRLLESLSSSGSSFPQIVIAVASDDTKTLSILTQVATVTTTATTTPVADETATSPPEHDDKGGGGERGNNNNNRVVAREEGTRRGDEILQHCWTLESKTVRGQTIHLVRLSEDCFTSADGLRQIEGTDLIHPATRVVVFPGDLVFLKGDVNFLDSLLRPPRGAACVALLVDVLEQDEHGQPLKESSKVRE
jgi:hypothetical protein